MTLICPFCNKNFTSSRHIETSNYSWFYCSGCNVSYKMNHDYNIVITRFHVYYRSINYGIDLCHSLQETHVIKLPNSMDELILVILTAPYMIGITPDNCQDKLKTLITFS